MIIPNNIDHFFYNRFCNNSSTHSRQNQLTGATVAGYNQPRRNTWCNARKCFSDGEIKRVNGQQVTTILENYLDFEVTYYNIIDLENVVTENKRVE
ncbi:MAG: hypothetical protein ACXAEU_21300 [Candidatus Hodarchaeales archaeon]|jgi:hypothetical protein